MKTVKMLTILVLGLLVCQAEVSNAAPMGTGWTYQGRLIDANDAADGLYDFQFKLFDDPCTGAQQGGTVDVNDLDVIDGYFTTELDFGSDVFDGDARWLEVGVRLGDSNDPNAFVSLSPRQEITPVPYALQTRGIFVDNSGNVGIGTTSPTARLHIQKGSADRNLILESTTFPGMALHDGTALKAFLFYDHLNAGVNLNTNGINGSGLVVKNNNVGIGTTSPGAKLDVVGDIKMNSGYAVGYPSSGSKIVVGYHDFGLISNGFRSWVPIPHSLSSVDQIIISLHNCSTTGFQVQPSGVQCCTFVSEGVWHQLVENKSGGSRYITTRWMAIGTP